MNGKKVASKFTSKTMASFIAASALVFGSQAGSAEQVTVYTVKKPGQLQGYEIIEDPTGCVGVLPNTGRKFIVLTSPRPGSPLEAMGVILKTNDHLDYIVHANGSVETDIPARPGAPKAIWVPADVMAYIQTISVEARKACLGLKM